MKVIIFSSILLLFISCTRVKEVFSKDYLYESILENTQKRDLIQSFETKATINATYLNNLDLDLDKSVENFLISLYITNDFKKQYALKNKFINILLNKKEKLTSKELNKNSKLLKTIDILNPWAKYFLVSFETQDTNELDLTIRYKNMTSSMKFIK